ncbi:head-tail connector protein [Shimia sp.]|uniref:head-tail connector protein n=1 Tax=Shimia sp. TaxID=1954381 RepID=UPI003B8B1467
MFFEVTDEPTEGFLTSADPVVRQHLSLSEGETDWDYLIDALLRSAWSQAENHIRQKLLTQTVQAYACVVSAETLKLPVGPVQSVVSVEHLDSDGEWLSVSQDSYRTLTKRSGVVVSPKSGSLWPVEVVSDEENLRVTYVAGYGDTFAALPADILDAIRILTAFAFENRGDDPKAVFPDGMHPGAMQKLNAHRVWF